MKNNNDGRYGYCDDIGDDDERRGIGTMTVMVMTMTMMNSMDVVMMVMAIIITCMMYMSVTVMRVGDCSDHGGGNDDDEGQA